MSRFWPLLLLGILVLAGCGSAASSAGSYDKMSVIDLKAKLDANEQLLLLDVRTPEEFQNDGHIKQATLIPLQELESRLNELPSDTPIACICRSGNRSSSACSLLAKRGFTVTNVEGGMIAWNAAGFPSE